MTFPKPTCEFSDNTLTNHYYYYSNQFISMKSYGDGSEFNLFIALHMGIRTNISTLEKLFTLLFLPCCLTIDATKGYHQPHRQLILQK